MPATLTRVELKVKNLPAKSKIEFAIESKTRIRELETFLVHPSGREESLGKKEMLFTSIKKNEEKDKDGNDTYKIEGYYRQNGNPFGYPGDGDPFMIKKAKFK